MKLEHYPVEKIKKEIRAIVEKHLDLKEYKLFFFGSRVDGKNHKGSDIDVGIEGPERISSPVWLEIQEEIENLPILYKIEIVDFKRVSREFKEVALSHAEPIK
ncbi:hypothetical protein A3A21_02710 [Candidatus Jorgensenbacteria bacterium RIFCSPLOWO2_01_FULL_45_25b]|uniref:Polymerase beta nucleotidyltransferase domain-containing protein n=1 Tax=Candidatus Jorgensenbacteria bacterium RIFCSPLOWO2_01_FULL_45_25b TaxID=1798471 RepID=A0A1F6BZW9_9BACT|nr:MAG: hypothetical protein A3A21_02710 [Candidatus Jorgensenbacteria bacterium RIFCSPLOWO2_01_FULL_45_25b]